MIEAALITLMEADTPLTALVPADEFHAVVAPQGTSSDHVVYSRVDTNHGLMFDNTAYPEVARFQCACYSKTFLTTRSIVAALKALLHGYRGTVEAVRIGLIKIENDVNLYDDTTEFHYAVLDFMVRYRE